MAEKIIPLFDEIDLAVANPDDRFLNDFPGRRHRQKHSAGNQDIRFFMMDVHGKSPLETAVKTCTKRGEIPSKDRDGMGLGSIIIYPEMPV